MGGEDGKTEIKFKIKMTVIKTGLEEMCFTKKGREGGRERKKEGGAVKAKESSSDLNKEHDGGPDEDLTPQHRCGDQSPGAVRRAKLKMGGEPS